MSKKPTPKKPNNRKVLINLMTILFVILIIIGGLYISDGSNFPLGNETKPYTNLVSLARDKKVSKIILSDNGSRITAEIYKDNDENRDRDNVEVQEFKDLPGSNTLSSNYEILRDDIKDSGVQFGNSEDDIIFEVKEPSFLSTLFSNSIFQTGLLLAGTFLIGLFLIKKLGDMNSRSISFGNARNKQFDEKKDKKITFEDVAGNDEAKQELLEVVDFLKRPDDYQKMGAKIPRGVLLVGAPGNGKTLMARAVAGEAGVPFLYVSGSEFVEMFVGVGASRVRDLFKQAKKKAPCIIFIDEIDAVGRQRGAGLGGGNDEREQTLNQILVELDGFDPSDSVIVIGATNRPDVLDNALLRPGRFDRQVTVTSPDRKERELILKLHSKNKKFEENVDLSIIARRTPGFSGADLQNVLNEAAILAVREKSETISNDHAREAIEKVMLGPSLKSKVVTEKQKMLTAYHEAGHALVQTIIPECNKVQKITIIPRGRAGGYTFGVEADDDSMMIRKSKFYGEISALFGGYCAEELIFGEVSTGASNDLQRATEMAKNMVTKYGMSDLGPISFDEGKGMSFLGKDMMEKQSYSEATAANIDLETRKILDTAYKRTQSILANNKKVLESITNALMENEVIELEEFQEITKEVLNKGE